MQKVGMLRLRESRCAQHDRQKEIQLDAFAVRALAERSLRANTSSAGRPW